MRKYDKRQAVAWSGQAPDLSLSSDYPLIPLAAIPSSRYFLKPATVHVGCFIQIDWHKQNYPPDSGKDSGKNSPIHSRQMMTLIDHWEAVLVEIQGTS